MSSPSPTSAACRASPSPVSTSAAATPTGTPSTSSSALRIDPGLLRELENIAKQEGVTRTEIARRMLAEGLKRFKIQQALGKYRHGELSLERAAELAGLPLYEMFDLVLQEKIPAPFTPEEIRQEAEELLARLGGLN
ncbi:MAG TPA: ribbon-helix-helix protein, CopG family [Chloroflexi bacterium]|nr:ribbon-helix-helix protein, CopG family [Chloroflexota bacterium]